MRGLRTAALAVAQRGGDALALRSSALASRLVRRKVRVGEAVMWEMRLIGELPRGRLAVDVGAHIGMCTLPLAARFDTVIAFEPDRDAARRLLSVAPANAVVVTAACGEAATVGTLYSPVRATRRISALSTLVPEVGASPDHTESPAAVVTIDGLGLEALDFIKIDVEGHELSVLAGASETLARAMPAILVEAEERHRPGAPAAIAERLCAAGFAGFFVHGTDVLEVERFDPGRHQRPDAGPYANNFLYVPATDAGPWRDRLHRAARTG